MTDELNRLIPYLDKKNTESIGYGDLLKEEFIQNLDESYSVDKRGGGILVRNSKTPLNQIQTVHIFPHGGIKIPKWTKNYLDYNSIEQLGEVILQNRDTSTTHVAKKIITSLLSQNKKHCVAYFQVSRVLIDANRIEPKDQVSGDTYQGKSPIKKEHLDILRKLLVDQLLIPWLDSVNTCIKQSSCKFVVHHHTYEKYSLKDLIHEQEPFKLRPEGQIFQQKNTKETQLNVSFLNKSTLEKLVFLLRNDLSKISTNPEFRIDSPYKAPPIPFWGCTLPIEEPQHIIYEIRKDILEGKENVEIWANSATSLINRLQSK